MEQMFEPGALVAGKYRIEHVLGKGGMGVVVAARHVQLGELFAIKVMLPAALADRDGVERFLREARASVRLKGEHVARVQDVGNLENGAPYMVMEHLQGRDLKDVLKQRGPLPVEDVALYVYQACDAVAEAHALNIVHRDLKPGNLYLTTRANGTPCVKVLDFGLAKDLMASKELGSDLTTTGTFMGSPRYMSPEQMRQAKAADTRSDIWSLGVIMYELATGKTPFQADSITELVSEVLTSQPDRPSELRPTISKPFEAIVMRCLEKQPDARYQSVRELMAALRPLITADLVGERVSATPMPALVPTSNQVATDDKTVALADAVGTAATIPAQETGVSKVTASAPITSNDSAGPWGNTAKKAPERHSDGPVKIIAGVVAFLAVGMLVFWISTRKTATDAPIQVHTPTSEQSAVKPEMNAPTTPATNVATAANGATTTPLPSASAVSSAAVNNATGAAPTNDKIPGPTKSTPTANSSNKTKPSDLTLY